MPILEIKKEEKPKAVKVTKLDDFMHRFALSFQIVFIMIIFIIGFFLVIKPKYDNIYLNYDAELNAKKNDLTNYKALENKYKNYILSYENISEYDKETLDDIIPEEDKYGNLYAELERIAESQGVILRSVEVQPEKKVEFSEAQGDAGNTGINPKLGIINAQADFEGTNYQGFKNLLQAIERNQRILDIQEISFSPNEYKSTLKLITYYFR